MHSTRDHIRSLAQRPIARADLTVKLLQHAAVTAPAAPYREGT
jgi:hypothetical protein